MEKRWLTDVQKIKRRKDTLYISNDGFKSFTETIIKLLKISEVAKKESNGTAQIIMIAFTVYENGIVDDYTLLRAGYSSLERSVIRV